MTIPELPVTAAWDAVRPGAADQLTSEDGLRLQRALETQGDGFRIRVRFLNAGDGPVRLRALSPAVIEHGGESDWFRDGLDGWAVYLTGRAMTSDVLTHRFARGERHETFRGSLRRETADGIAYHSHLVMLLHHAALNRSLLLGFVTTDRQHGEIVLTCSADERELVSIDARSRTEAILIPPGGAVESESVVVLAGDDPVALMDEYAQILGRTMRARVGERVPSGWCSWYYYYNRVSERDILANLVALQTGPLRVEYVQVDDGWQQSIGDWFPNEKFGRGMAFLAERIRAAGFRPGLWLSPLTLHRDSRVLAAHPDWAVRDQDGEIIWSDIWLGPVAGLDCTHPEARAWLAETISRAVHEWGYSFLKLDALNFGSHPEARYHLEGTTSAANLRAGLEIIRAAAGDETFILGCSCPFGPAVGLVDAMRVSQDVEARWFHGVRPSAKQALRLSLGRWWMHRRLWLNDPDCLTVREQDSTLTAGEARFLATGIALSGGLTVISDDLTALSPERAEIARRVLPTTGLAARPLDLFERETPALWRLPRLDGSAYAFLNWTDAPATLATPIRPTDPPTGIERWSGQTRIAHDGLLTEPDLAPHTARVIRLSPDPAALAPDGHILA